MLFARQKGYVPEPLEPRRREAQLLHRQGGNSAYACAEACNCSFKQTQFVLVHCVPWNPCDSLVSEQTPRAE